MHNVVKYKIKINFIMKNHKKIGCNIEILDGTVDDLPVKRELENVSCGKELLAYILEKYAGAEIDTTNDEEISCDGVNIDNLEEMLSVEDFSAVEQIVIERTNIPYDQPYSSTAFWYLKEEPYVLSSQNNKYITDDAEVDAEVLNGKIVNLPDNITKIGLDAFEGCKNLKLIVNKGTVTERTLAKNGVAYLDK